MKMSALCAAAVLAPLAQANNIEDELTSLWEIPNRNPDDLADLNEHIESITSQTND